MKFLRLDLLAYGPFTNRSLVLPASGPNLHIIYGLNEAGKSTTLRAISGLLYGIAKDTGDAHRHTMSELRIGARLLHSKEGERGFVRKKGLQGTLLNEAGSTVDETLLRSWLSVTDRKQFELMFGLDHEQLREAGKALTNPKTSLGETLFGAALNGTALQQTLHRLEDDANKLLSPGGNAGAIQKALAAYREQTKRARDRALPVKAWKDLRDALDAAEAKRAELSAELVRLQTDRHRLQRLQRALPLVRTRGDARAERAAMGDVRLLPRDIGVRRAEIVQALEAAAQQVRKLHADIEWTERERDQRGAPVPVIITAASIKQLTEDLGKYKTELRDKPGVVKEIMGFRNREREILRELGQPTLEFTALESIRVSEAAVQRIRALEKSGVQLETALAQLRGQLADRRAVGAKKREDLAGLPALPDVAVLRTTRDLLQPDRKLDAAVRDAEALVHERTARAQHALQALGFWTGSLEKIPTVAVPSEETIRRCEQELDEDERTQKRLTLAREQKTAELATVERKVGQCTDAGSLPSEAQLSEARSRRSQAWERVQRAWTNGADPECIDEVFAPGVALRAELTAVMQRADELADRLRRESDRVATLVGLQREEAVTRTAIDALDAELARAKTQANAHLAAWNEHWLPCGFTPDTPREMGPWRRRHAELVAAIQQRDGAIEARQRLLATQTDQRRSLEGALALAGVAVPAEAAWLTVLLLVDHTLDSVAKRSEAEVTLRKEIDAAQLDLATMTSQIAEKESALDRWRKEWGEAVTVLRLPPEALPEEANVVLSKLGELFREEELCERQEARFRAINRQGLKFEEGLGALAQSLEVTLPEKGPMADAADALIARFDEVAKNAVLRRERDELAERYRRELQDADLREADAQRRLEAMLVETGCDDLAALAAAEERSALARACDERQAAAERRLVEEGEGWSLEALEQAAAQTDSDRVEADIARLKDDQAQRDEERHALAEKIGALRKEEEQLSGGDEAAAALAEAQENLALARSHAERCARLRLATAVLRRGVERYRKNNEGAILQRATRLFERLTGGRYEQIQVVYQDDKAKLRCVRRGQLVEVEEALSDGTLDQLFLSLRLASLEQHLDAQEPMPLVLDDIFIHFDDERATAGLEVLAEFAAKTQVLLLTHHARNLDLARRALAPEQWTEHRLGAALPAETAIA